MPRFHSLGLLTEEHRRRHSSHRHHSHPRRVQPLTRPPLPASLIRDTLYGTDSPASGDTDSTAPTRMLPSIPLQWLKGGEGAAPATTHNTHRHSCATLVYLGPAAACAASPGTSGLSTASARAGRAAPPRNSCSRFPVLSPVP